MHIWTFGKVILTTHLILDKPSILNSIANVALGPLQFIIGQNKWGLEKKKVTKIPTSHLETVAKIMICAAAITAIPTGGYTKQALKTMAALLGVAALGIVARYFSLFFSQEVQRGFRNIFRTYIRRPRTEVQSVARPDFKVSLQTKIKKDTQFFKTLSEKLEASKDTALKWLEEQKKTTYSYPFYTAISLINQMKELPQEADSVFNENPEYVVNYYQCEARKDSRFDIYFDEKDPVEGRSLEQFLKT